MKSDESAQVYQSGFNCSQAVFVPFAKANGLSEELGARIGSSFGAGMGKMQETCGAVTGAFMAIGLKHGFTKGDDRAQKDIALARTREFIAKFKAEFGTLLCKELLGCDLNTAEGQKIHTDQNQRDLICTKCVRFAASVVEGMS